MNIELSGANSLLSAFLKTHENKSLKKVLKNGLEIKVREFEKFSEEYLLNIQKWSKKYSQAPRTQYWEFNEKQDIQEWTTKLKNME